MELNKKIFTSYEYKEVDVQEDIDLQYLDALQCFGWEIEEERSSTEHYVLRRFRHLVNKIELTRLQRNLDSCFKEILKINHSIYSYATMVSINVGLIGVSFMICAVYAFIYETQLLPIVIVLSVIGLVGLTLPYFVYLNCKEKRKYKMEKYFDQKYDEIEKICTKALEITKL